MKPPWVAIQRNPTSGAGPNQAHLLELATQLRSHKLKPRLFSNRERLTQRLADPQWRKSLVCIVAAGGDGTVGDVINRYPDCPIAVLPLGTENLLAKYLGVPKSGRAVADMIAAGNTRHFDLGVINDRRFILMASFGFDADVIHRVHENRTGFIGKWSYFKPICRSLRKYKHPEMRLYIDGAEVATRSRLTVVANLPAYARQLKIAASACGDDGLLDLRLFKQGSTFQMFRYLYKVIMGTHEQLADVDSIQAKRVRVESDQPVPIQVDGDPAGWTPAEISVLPSALNIFTPHSEFSN